MKMHRWRCLFWLGAALLALGLARPASAQTVEFFTDPTCATAWPTTDASTTPATPLIEWGDTVWVKFTNVAFAWDAATPPPTPVAYFERVEPVPANTLPRYYFKLSTNVMDGPNRVYRVGVDFGFYCKSGTDPAVNSNWKLGVPQRHKTVAANVVSEDPTAGDSQISGFSGTQALAVNGILLTPGLWKVWAEQDIDNNGTPEAQIAPVFIRVMNPIGVAYYDATNTPVTPYANTPAGNGVNGDPGFASAPAAAYANKRVLPGATLPPANLPDLTLGQVDHGRTSAAYQFGVFDRSKLYQVANPAIPPDVNLQCRVGHGDLNPTGLPMPTNWDSPTPAAPRFDLYEYPPVFADRVTVQKADTGEDPRTMPISLPFGAAGVTNPVKFVAQIRVPLYQPDTTYGTGWEGVESNPALFDLTAAPGDPRNQVHDADPVRVWYDFDGNGKLNREPLGTRVVYDPAVYPNYADGTDPTLVDPNKVPPPAAYESVPAAATDPWQNEPYREFNVTVNVPTDRRLAVDEKVVDLGKHPHNSVLGLTPVELPAIRPITVRNLGNVNLIHLRVADSWHDTVANTLNRISMYCPGTEYDSVVGSGVAIPPAELDTNGNDLRRHFWWSFNSDATIWSGAGQEGQLRKARPDAPQPTSTGGFWLGGQSVQGPRISVISPFGQPTGTYASPWYRIYEDVPGSTAGVLDGYTDSSGVFHPAVDVATDAFTVKISVTDRQLTEEIGPNGAPGVYGIDRRKVLQAGAPSGAGVIPRYAGDSQPAALRYRDNTGPHLALVWASNRADSRHPTPSTLAAAGDSWYLYGSRTVEDVYTSATYYPWPYWMGSAGGPAPAANDPEFKYPKASAFSGLSGVESERYTTPSLVPTIDVATLQPLAPYYLFFQGDAFTRDANNVARHAVRPFYTPLDTSLQTTANLPSRIGREQMSGLKHGTRGLAYQQGTTSLLWSFWYGGPDGQARAFYTWTDSATDPSTWRPEQRLPLYADFTSVQDLNPMVWMGYADKDAATGTLQPYIHMVFTGTSAARGSSGIYMAELDPAKLQGDAASAAQALRPFARVRQEVLSVARNSNNRVFLGKNLEWQAPNPATDPFYATVGGQKEFLFPRLWVYTCNAQGQYSGAQITPDPETASQATMKGWQYNAADNSYTYEYSGYTSTAFADLNGKNQVTLYPHAGMVVLSKPLDNNQLLVADYVPQIVRISDTDQLETAPSAFLDARYGPAASPTPTTVNGNTYFPRIYRQRDRLWTFWTRRASQVGPPTIYSKPMRAMVELPGTLNPSAAITVQDVTASGGDITGQVSIDPAKRRVYFPRSLEGHRVTVTVGSTVYPTGGMQPLYVHWGDEAREAPLPIDAVSNEGKVCAFPDIPPALDTSSATTIQAYLNDPATWRTWVIWSSSRPKVTAVDANGVAAAMAYDTDLRYMTLAPQLDVWATP